jgi:hypothetical protein
MRTKKMSLLGALGIVAALAAGCGGSDGSGVARTMKLSDLTPDQAKAVCNYANNKQGGYDRTVTCTVDGLDHSTYSSEADCITLLPGGLGSACPELTVGDYEGCAEATGTDLCKDTTAAGCAALEACYHRV